jgi:hypothetical protein
MSFLLLRKILWWLAVAATIALPKTFQVGAFVVLPRSHHSSSKNFSRNGSCPPVPRRWAALSSSVTTPDDTTAAAPTLDMCLDILTRAAETKSEDSEIVVQALIDLERLVRIEAKQNNELYASELFRYLNGSWRLIFTTGTKKTQDKIGKINYFPIKAVQSFDTATMAIANGLYVGDFRLVQFAGTFDYDATKRRIEFDFTKLTLFQLIDLTIGRGQAAQIGAQTGLGSDSNVANAAKNKRAFFNWISANADIATARGGGGGLALWKRVT